MITRLASAIGVFQHISYTRRPLLPLRPPPEAMPWRRVVSATRYFSGEYQQVKAVEEEKHSYEKKNENLKLCNITMTPFPHFFFYWQSIVWSSHYTLLAATKPHSVSLRTMWSPRPPAKKNSPPPPKGDKYRLVPHHIQLSFPLTTPLP